MALGPGRYDELCTKARLEAEADGALLIIVGGKHGYGFACQAPKEYLKILPGALRGVADQIEADLKMGKL